MAGEYYSLSVEETLKSLETSKEGLSAEEASERLKRYGFNEIEDREKTTPLKIFVRQFTSFIIFILLAAIVVSLLIGEQLDALVIAVIVVINGILGFIQEYKAEKAIEALRKLTALKARVIRDGVETELDSRELVPGDIILLETGDKVPADARLSELIRLDVDESSLTGESIPVKKELDIMESDAGIIGQRNMVFMATIVSGGHAKAVVVNTGMSTEIGKIAEMVQEVGEKLTPLQVKLRKFGKWLGFVTLGICGFVFLVGVLREYLTEGVVDSEFLNMMFLTAVSLAVAAIPEGLPAIVTISLALGVQRMVKRNALIRQLPAVETLGCTDVICSDKTGTLTKNEMTVREIYVNNQLINVSGEGYTPEGKFTDNNNQVVDTENIEALLRVGVLCNDARWSRNGAGWRIFGDPTEGALIVSAAKAGLDKEELEKRYPRVDEIAFDSERKCMTTVHEINGEKVAYIKGAPDVVLNKCMRIHLKGKLVELNGKDRARILQVNDTLAENARRVLGFAYKPLKEGMDITPKEVERDLIFVGLQGMIDPPRPEVKDAIVKCNKAGIKTVMITGDHKSTAMAIAQELALFKDHDIVLTGGELDKLSNDEFSKIVEEVAIYARVSPHHKSRILDALKEKGHVVAMTGDGVNDAPALKKSDIGVAMGLTGTDVAKEASDMILTDDNFTSIVNAVEEGRGIYNSIKNFIQYTLSSNLGEILVIFLAILIGMPLPLIAIQILWVNLLTDGLPGLALGLDPYDKDIMKKKPRRRDGNIMSKDIIHNILIVGVVMCVGVLLMFRYYGAEIGMNLANLGSNAPKAQTIAFTTLIMFQLFNVLTYRAKNFRIDVRTSKFLIGSVIISVLLQFAVLYTPLNIAFKTIPLNWLDWLKIIATSSTLFIILETRKWLINRKTPKVTYTTRLT